ERDVRDIRRALGIGRAAKAARALTIALGCVALERAVLGEAERVAAARDHATVAAHQLRLRVVDAKHCLDALEVRAELLGAELVEPELALPAAQHAIRRAIAGSRVDRRRAADRLAERNHDADVADRERRATAPIQLLLHLERTPGEVLARVVAAFFDEHDG